MGSIGCDQGQAEGNREPPVPVPISEGFPQDVLQSFRIQENQEDIQPLHLALAWEQSIPLFSGEMREFLPACLGDLDWFSRGMSMSGHLVDVRKLDLSHLCFSLNFYFLMLLSQFPSIFSLANLFSIIPFPHLLITRDT